LDIAAIHGSGANSHAQKEGEGSMTTIVKEGVGLPKNGKNVRACEKKARRPTFKKNIIGVW